MFLVLIGLSPLPALEAAEPIHRVLVINSFYSTYTGLVWAVSGAISLLSALLLLLIVNILRRRRLEKALQESYNTLEIKVNDRIRDLKEANERLGQEITERGRAEQTLRALLDSITETALLLDQEGRVLASNEVAAKRLGTSVPAILGKSVFDFLSSDVQTSRRASFEAVLKEAKPLRVEDSRGGKAFDSHWYPILGPDGSVKQVTVFAVDITNRVRSDEERIRAEKSESVGIMAGGIAHDFNNLLTGIMGFVDLARMNMAPGSKASKYLDETLHLCLRAKELTGRFSTFSRAGGPARKIVALGLALKDVTSLALAGANVNAEFTIEEDLWRVKGDEAAIRDVITIVVTNAKEAMPKGGILRIGAENRTEKPGPGDGNGCSVYDRWVHVSFEDKGVGIPEEYIPRLFDPYFSTKERGTQKGMGLSLATAHSIMERHGGTIEIESRVNVGTTVHLWFPVLSHKVPGPEKESDAIPTTTSSAKTGGRARILVMDDDEAILKVAVQILDRLGYEVIPAKEGHEAVEHYRKAYESGRPIDALILDLTVRGGMGGRETMKEILKIHPQARGIVSSGYADDPVMRDFYQYGFKAAVTKPYEMRNLFDCVKRVVEGKLRR